MLNKGGLFVGNLTGLGAAHTTAPRCLTYDLMLDGMVPRLEEKASAAATSVEPSSLTARGAYEIRMDMDQVAPALGAGAPAAAGAGSSAAAASGPSVAAALDKSKMDQLQEALAINIYSYFMYNMPSTLTNPKLNPLLTVQFALREGLIGIIQNYNNVQDTKLYAGIGLPRGRLITYAKKIYESDQAVKKISLLVVSIAGRLQAPSSSTDAIKPSNQEI